jgi:hypothetical protein
MFYRDKKKAQHLFLIWSWPNDPWNDIDKKYLAKEFPGFLVFFCDDNSQLVIVEGEDEIPSFATRLAIHKLFPGRIMATKKVYYRNGDKLKLDPDEVADPKPEREKKVAGAWS